MMNRSTSFFFGYQNQISGTESEFSRDSLNDKDIGGPGGSYDDRISIESLKTVDDLIVSLDVLNIQGPLTLHAPFLKSLGKGAQFSVTQGSLLESGMTSGGSAINLDEEVAVKCPLFAATDRRLDLTSRSSRRQIHDIYLEIAILRNSTLQGHRNIVRLIGWGLDHRHKMPLLVLELAIGDLSSVLASPKSLISESVAQQLSLDIGHGLDAIHDLGIVHGDLKPPNILLFQSPHLVPFVAKLADFGLSLSELHSEEDSLVAVAGMSVDWCAPEIKSMAKLTASHFVKADNFSYGLVLLSLNCLNGRPPKSKNLDTAIDIVGSHRTLSSSFRDHLAKALSLLLHEDPTKRLMCVKNVMKNSSEACTTWEKDETDRISSVQREAFGPHFHAWNLPPLDAYHFLGLEESSKRYAAVLSGPKLFAMFVFRSLSEVSMHDKSVQMSMLLAAVDKGHIPAQAIVQRVSASYGQPLSLPGSSIRSFLYAGASNGSIVALCDLFALDPALASAAQLQFQEKTGYNQFFSPLKETDISADFFADADSNTRLHYISARGDRKKLAEALRDVKFPSDINARNRHGETPLYKACLSGIWETVELLCKHGADAGISSFLNDLTCMHWLFNFPTALIDRALTVLIDSGGDINAKSRNLLNPLNCHFPFKWPTGTPLHFAVHASNLPATKALLRRGAQATIRDGRDPYISDGNVRVMSVHGSVESGEISVPDRPPLGFNAVDLAAAMYEHELLDAIRTNSAEETFMAPDEEGYTPFHRLSFLRIVRTSHGVRFWYPAFRGDPVDSEARLTKTIQALQHMGGDINQLTDTPTEPALKGVSGLSPLMIAITKSDYETANALLKAGAQVDAVNRDGRSAIMLLADVDDPCVTPDSLLSLIRLLLCYGADVNLKSLDGTTPIGVAIYSRSMPCIKALIGAGANLSVEERDLSLIARLICRFRYIDGSYNTHALLEQELVEILRNFDMTDGLRAHRPDRYNGSLLHYAAYAGYTECVALLLGAGLEVDQIRKRRSKRFAPEETKTDGTAIEIVEFEETRFKNHGHPMLSSEEVTSRLKNFEKLKDILRKHQSSHREVV